MFSKTNTFGPFSRPCTVVRFVTAVAVFIFLSYSFGEAAEKWSDPALPVQDGLELWLDASRATGATPIPAESKLKQWQDASGKNRALQSPDANAQPSLLKIGNAAIARFDGIDDQLRATGLGAKLDSFTIVIVAAARQNVGGFSALMALNATNERDYTSGLNVDLGPLATTLFSTLNVEGRGFSGVQNLRTHESNVAGLHTLVIASDAKEKTVRLLVDGQEEGQRPRSGEPVSADEITIGARYFNNGTGPQHVDGFGHVDIAELLVFNRSLTSSELASLRKYFDARYLFIKDVLPSGPEASAQLEKAKDPPPVQVFAPGFTVRQLPLDLTNINNVQYRVDGTLVVQAYDGKIWLLRDTDQDGLEDKAELFWNNPSGLRSPIGMDLTPPDFKLGNGVFVVGKTHCADRRYGWRRPSRQGN